MSVINGFLKNQNLSHSLSLNFNFNLSVLYWHDKSYTFVLPKQLQLGCSQIVHICINRKENNNKIQI